MMTLEEKYKILKWNNYWTIKIIGADFYSNTEDHKKELEFEKTAPRRRLDICKQCPHFSNALSMKTPNKKLKNRYNCEQHSKAVVQEEFGIRQWTKAFIPMNCPFCTEVKIQEWNKED